MTLPSQLTLLAVCGVGAKWVLDRLGHQTDRFLDTHSRAIQAALWKWLGTIPSKTKQQLLKLGKTCIRVAIQGLLLYGMISFALPIYLATHLTQRQATILVEAILPGPTMTVQKRLVNYLHAHSGILMELPEPEGTCLLLSDHQHLVGLGLLEDGPISVGKGELAWSTQKAKTVSYHSKITFLGRNVVWWRLLLDKAPVPLVSRKATVIVPTE